MRDLQKDLEDYHRYMNERSLKVIDLMVDSLPHAIDRALRGENFIKGLNKELADAQDQKSRAEAEVELLRADKNKLIDVILKQEAELTLLRKVAEAARAYLKGGYNETLDELVLTVLELDKESDLSEEREDIEGSGNMRV